MDVRDEKSPKSYGVAVILCGIFGTLGIHHFYLGNIVHGIFDLGLFLLFCVLFFGNAPLLGILVLLVDVAHTIYVFSMLIVEKWHDGEGRRVTL
ncbi:TM2 domain-containing protein [uncultured Litoreibacter sp.]|uniref:TM2 domain-containing protein n=1 Tax=uncultured Litoreibacter sp. TaxID=1392394 RepID=UPI00261DAB6E|nr:TM2 domain-containing protein [uncultured Litoreibacter sp.]